MPRAVPPADPTTNPTPRGALAGAGWPALRAHSYHSLLTGVDTPLALLERAAELGCPALALTDVDATAGWVDFLKAARHLEQRGVAVRPILGAELSDPSGAPGRLIALVQSEQGYQNLCRLVSARHLGTDPGVPGARLSGPTDFELVRAAMAHHEGLIFLADHPRLLLGLFGRVPAERLYAAISPASLALDARSRAGQPAAAVAGIPAGWDMAKVPPPQAPIAARELVEAARAVGVATLAVPDVHYARVEGRADHRARIAIKHNALLCDLPPAWLAPEPAHLQDCATLCALYAGLPDVPGPLAGATATAGVPGALARTLPVAESCRYTPPLGRVLFPRIELAAGETPYSRLCALAFDGARVRYHPIRPEVVRRLDYELLSIERLGFAPYFLLVHRIATFAREQGIPCVGRGSAADSLVAFCMGLTDADPLRYRLPFERFLNPARRDRPDIDLDFCWRRRDEVLAHVYAAFGPERTAMISTLNRFGLRSAFREAALVHGLPPVEVGRWSRRLPWAESNAFALRPPEEGGSVRGFTPQLAGNPLAIALVRTPECRSFPFDDERWRAVLAVAAGLLDAPRHFGLHPGGVVVAPGPISALVSCRRAAKGVVMTDLDKDAVEALGLVKMDLLGNRALTTLDDGLRMLRARGVELDLERIPEDDPATAALLREGQSLGCFQVESPGMRHLLQQIRAEDMDAVIQAVALIRPGPAGSGMKDAYVRRVRGLEAPDPPHPHLAEVLADTHGVMLYQEDVMRVAVRIAGMDLAEADQLRRALQKHRGAELAALRQRFLSGARERGVEARGAEHVWELMANFASFGFCKAHAVTYGRIAYRAAYMKAHHPAVFLTAFLCSETGYYDARVYVEEARRLGVPILGPEVNKSAVSYALEWRRRGGEDVACLRVGLGQVRGLSQRSLAALLDARAQGGPFLSLPDLLERTGAHTDEALALVQCGALDAFDRTRPELLWRLHLLRSPGARPPRELARPGSQLGGPLDPAQLAACRATPSARAREALESARATTGGWRGGLGLTRAALAPGESAALFPEPPTPAPVLPGLPDLDRRTRGLLEQQLLGFAIELHPTELFPCGADERLAAAGAPPPPNPIGCGELARFAGGRVTLRGWLAASRRVRTKNGEWMRFLTLEDRSGIAEVVLFPGVYTRDGHLLVTRGPHTITGTVEADMGACTLHAERVW